MIKESEKGGHEPQLVPEDYKPERDVEVLLAGLRAQKRLLSYLDGVEAVSGFDDKIYHVIGLWDCIEDGKESLLETETWIERMANISDYIVQIRKGK